MPHFYLIRHGEKERTQGDPPLTTVGIEQAQKTGQYLRQFPITHIMASPLLRTQQTAQYIADALATEASDNAQVGFETAQLLKERANWGDDPNQSFEDFVKMWNQATTHRDLLPHVGDSSRRAGQRIEELMQKFVQTDHQHIALVTHGGTITDFLRNVFAEEHLDTHLENFSMIRDAAIRECSVTVVEYDGRKSQLHVMAYRDHLE